MNLLVLNTAFAALDACILSAGEDVTRRRLDLARGHEQHLAEFMAALIGEAGLDFKDLQRVAVITGPGSFTGVRIGVAYMRGLALSLGVPCLGFTSLEAAADSAPGPGLACLAAKKRQPEQSWWIQRLENGLGAGDVQECSAERTQAMLSTERGPVWFDAPETLEDFPDVKDLRPFVIDLAVTARKARGADPRRFPPSPVYARAPDAALPKPRA